MPRYEEIIARFSQDKEFLRLSRPVRGRADAVCDACGSTQPRTLYGLTDIETGRHYFVGDSCLKELMKTQSILRRFGKLSGNQAYRDEMQLRVGRADNSTNPADGEGVGSENINYNDFKTEHSESGGPLPRGGDTISSQVILVETRGYYQGFVALFHDGTNRAAFGTACVAKYEGEWRLGGASGLVLENLKNERADAPVLCLAEAWQKAYSNLEGTGAEGTPTLPGNFAGAQIENNLLQPGVLRLVATPAAEAHHGL